MRAQLRGSKVSRKWRSSLVRRISLDLTGLPPAPELLKKYAASEKLTDAQISQLIDELMKSPAYGEHRARYWLDAARYGDTHGLHFDKTSAQTPKQQQQVCRRGNQRVG